MANDVIIGGDVCILPPQVNNDIISENATSFFQDSDLNIINLECPIINSENDDKIIKTGPHISTTTQIFKHLKKLNIHAVTLANNHILDYGEKGLISTLESCSKEHISITGAGKNLKEAANPAIVEINGQRIALVNFCENEWSAATESSGGANPYNIIDNLNQIKAARKQADFVLVIIHGGHEIYNLPSPRMVKEYRFFAENGADAVIGHHPHCISGYEIHKSVPIFYSLGNMLFTKDTNYNGWYKGLIVKLHLEKNQPVQFELFPTYQSKHTFQFSLQEGANRENALAEIDGYSKIISNETELLRNWEEFIIQKTRTLNLFSPLNVLPWKFPNIFQRLGFNRFMLRRNNMAQMLNHIRCEAHRDVVISLFKNNIYKELH